MQGVAGGHLEIRAWYNSVSFCYFFLALSLAPAISVFPFIWRFCYFFQLNLWMFGRGGGISGICYFHQIFPFLTVDTPVPNFDLITFLFSSSNLLKFVCRPVWFSLLWYARTQIFVSAIVNAGQKRMIIFGLQEPQT